jgi:hypothetical protein
MKVTVEDPQKKIKNRTFIQSAKLLLGICPKESKSA